MFSGFSTTRNFLGEKVKETSDGEESNVEKLRVVIFSHNIETIIEYLFIATKRIIVRKQFFQTLEQTNSNIRKCRSLEFIPDEIDKGKCFMLVGNQMMIVYLDKSKQYLCCSSLELIVKFAVI